MAADVDPTATPPDPKTRIPLTLERVLLAAKLIIQKIHILLNE